MFVYSGLESSDLKNPEPRKSGIDNKRILEFFTKSVLSVVSVLADIVAKR